MFVAKFFLHCPKQWVHQYLLKRANDLVKLEGFCIAAALVYYCEFFSIVTHAIQLKITTLTHAQLIMLMLISAWCVGLQSTMSSKLPSVSAKFAAFPVDSTINLNLDN